MYTCMKIVSTYKINNSFWRQFLNLGEKVCYINIIYSVGWFKLVAVDTP